ncbi:helix-turn-helix domain-containing protein [Kitasatospora mediocidica]|uniref:helix-turn-helix domain-containing protein n=1 Tax=Kitasatospora mediocidica TaxID=58352 RepID=UPI00056A3E71|nr:helix-turn-helix domain-containing protein [Kitasatospora mediocidica]
MASKREGLAARRKSLGHSQESFAEKLGIATSTVGRWESGSSAPQPHLRPRIARLLQVTATELDLLMTPQPVTPESPAVPESEDDDMDRRAFLSLLTITGTFVALPQIGTPPEPGDRTPPPAETAGALNPHLWQVFALSESKQAVYPLVRRQLGLLARGLEELRSEEARQRVCVLAADLYQLAGEIFFDRNRYTEAAQCYSLAASAAKEAGEHDLWACALTRHAFIGVYEHRFAAMAPMLSAASRVAQRGDSRLSTRYWVAAVQAEVYAALGNLDACNRALDVAERVGCLDGQSQNGGWLRFDGSRLAEQRGTCYLALGRPDLAEHSLTAALAQELSPRRRGAVLAELAALGAQRGDLDQLLHYSGAALELAGQTGSGFLGKKLRGLQPRLAPLMADGRVAELHHHISALAGAA